MHLALKSTFNYLPLDLSTEFPTGISACLCLLLRSNISFLKCFNIWRRATEGSSCPAAHAVRVTRKNSLKPGFFFSWRGCLGSSRLTSFLPRPPSVSQLKACSITMCHFLNCTNASERGRAAESPSVCSRQLPPEKMERMAPN